VHAAGNRYAHGKEDDHDSAHSILQPRVAAERVGIVPRVVSPTGVDAHADGALDVYYGMADSRIGVARAVLADLLIPAMAQVA
jgi:predicted GH43/DUF377 family glycosyl hydrolase